MSVRSPETPNPNGNNGIPLIAIAAEDLAQNPNKSSRYFRAVDATVGRVMAAIERDISKAAKTPSTPNGKKL